MAIVLILPATGGAPLSTVDYNAQNVNITAQFFSMDQNTLHLTEWDTLVKPKLQEDVYIPHGGALFQVQTSDYAITAAPANDRVYIKITRTLDELDAAFVNSAAGYSWNHVYNGFYHADGTQLLPYVLWKDNADYYKYTLDGSEDKFNIIANIWRKKTIDLGDWNMDTTGNLQVNHGLPDRDKIRAISCTIRRDSLSAVYVLYRFAQAPDPDLISGGILLFNDIYIDLYRRVNGLFDSADFDSIGFNRGWIYIEYVV